VAKLHGQNNARCVHVLTLCFFETGSVQNKTTVEIHLCLVLTDEVLFGGISLSVVNQNNMSINQLVELNFCHELVVVFVIPESHTYVFATIGNHHKHHTLTLF